MSNTGLWLSKFATAKNAAEGWESIFMLGSYCGSDTQNVILKIGQLFGHQFRPWEAVKVSSKVGKFGKVLGVGGALLDVGLQIWDDHQQEKMEKQLISYRGDIRNSFSEAANVIEMKFDEDTQTWIENNISPLIAHIDAQIYEIESSIQLQEKEFETYHELITQTRDLISSIQKEGAPVAIGERVLEG